MPISDKVMESLRKLLRLADNEAATPGEVQNAMAAAKRLALRHNLDLASVDVTDTSDSTSKFDVRTERDFNIKAAFWRRYHSWISYVLTETFGVRIIRSTYRDGSRERCAKLFIIGETTDVEVTKVMWAWLEELYPKSFRHEVNAGRIFDNAAGQNGYYRGLSAGILQTNKREEEQAAQSAQGQTLALVLRGKADAIALHVQEHFPHLKKSKPSKTKQRNYNETAALLGYHKGKKINLNQMGSGNGAPQIKG